MDSKRLGRFLLVAGAGLLLTALLLFGVNRREDIRAGEAAGEALAGIRQVIHRLPTVPPETSPEILPTQQATEPMESVPTVLAVVTVDGFDYIGYLSIPDHALELPVMADWSMEKLKTAPCLQYGSPLTDDAVIAGHNYKHHFRALHDIRVGASVSFTDMTGYTIDYTVANVRQMDPRNVYEVINSEYDLVLYTCTVGGQERVIVECDRADPVSEEGK